MDTVMIPETATELAQKLLRAWNGVINAVDDRDMDGRDAVIDTALTAIQELSAEHYDFRRALGSDTNIGFDTMRMYAAQQVRILEDLAVKLVLSYGGKCAEPKAAEYRRIFICTAVAAGQLMRPAHAQFDSCKSAYVVNATAEA